MTYLTTDVPAHIAVTAEAQKLIVSQASSFSNGINHILKPLVSPFRSISGRLESGDAISEAFSTVIFDNNFIADNRVVPIEAVSMVIESCDLLNLENLKNSVAKLSKIKSMPNAKNPTLPPITCGIIGKTSDLSLEQLADELTLVCKDEPSYVWLDFVAVLDKGVINYTAHSPGSRKSGDFLLTSKIVAENSPAPSLYVYRVIRAYGDQTFNKIAALAMQGILLCRRDLKLSSFQNIFENLPDIPGVNVENFQFNLSNEMVAMTKQEIINSQLPGDNYIIRSGKDILGSIQYRTWQDGGVLVLQGKFPLDIFLVFLRQVVNTLSHNDLQFFRENESQVSYVLPVSKKQFLDTLDIFAKRGSNVTVERDVSKFLVRKLSDEGTTSPFYARMMMGIFNTYAIVSDNKADKDRFFGFYGPVLANLRSARDASANIRMHWHEHKIKVESEQVVIRSDRTIQISENVDRILKNYLDSFLTATGRAMKNGLQKLTKDLGIDIGFFFAKESAFNSGIAELRTLHPLLASYLETARPWSEQLQEARNVLEHGVFPEPETQYDINVTPIFVREPLVNGKPITDYVSHAFSNVSCFVEEVITYCLQQKMARGVNVTELPLAQRDKEAPIRFKLTVVPGGAEPWALSSHQRLFEEV